MCWEGGGGRDDAVVRALPSHQCGLWFELVVGSRLCSEGFSPGTPVFLPLLKPTLPNSNSTRNAWTPFNRVSQWRALRLSVVKKKKILLRFNS